MFFFSFFLTDWLNLEKQTSVQLSLLLPYKTMLWCFEFDQTDNDGQSENTAKY